MSLSSSTSKITGPLKCSSCLIFVAFTMVAFTSAMLFVTASGLSSIAPNCSPKVSRLLMSLAKGFYSAFDPVDALLAVRVLGIMIKFVHWRVGDELQSNLLELCTTLLVDASGASSSVMIESVTRALMMIFSAVSGCSNVFSSISINAQMLELYGPRNVQTPRRPACCRENGQLISRILRQMSRTKLHMRRVTVLPTFQSYRRNPYVPLSRVNLPTRVSTSSTEVMSLGVVTPSSC